MRTKKSLLNFAMSLTGSGMSKIAALIATPLLLRSLGEERLGAYRALTEWFGYMSLFEFGMAPALLGLLAQGVGSGNHSRVRSILSAGIKTYMRTLPALMLAGMTLAYLIPHLLETTSGIKTELKTAALLLACALLLFPLAPIRYWADANQRQYRVSQFSIGQNLTTVVLAVLFARCGLGLAGQSLATVAGLLFFNFCLCWYWRRLNPKNQKHPSLFQNNAIEPEVRKELGRLNASGFAINLAGRVSVLSDNLIIAGLINSAAVMPYVLTRNLIQMAADQLQGLGTSSWAALGELHAQNKQQLFNARLIDLTQLAAVLSLCVLVPIAAYTGAFVGLWVGPRFYGGNALTAVMACNAFFLIIQSIWGWAFTAARKINHLVVPIILMAIINVAVSLGTTRTSGIMGPALGTMTSIYGFGSWISILLLKSVFGISPFAVFKAIGKPILAALPWAVIVLVLSRVYNPTTWVRLGVQMSASAITYLVIWWFLGFTKADKTIWKNRLKMLTPSGRNC